MQKEVVEVSKREKLSAFDLCVRLANGSGLIALNIHQKKGVRDFVKTIRDMRMHAVDVRSFSSLLVVDGMLMVMRRLRYQ